MSKTHAPHGAKTNALTQFSAGLFAAHMGRNSNLNRLVGKMPQGTKGAEATLRKQTTAHMPIVRCQDLGKGAGDEVKFHLLNPVSAKPIMGDEVAENKGVGLSISEAKLRVNQARFPVDLGSVMTGIRSPVDLRALGRPVAQSLMDRYADQSLLVHMAGARGFYNNVEWVLPTADDKDFAKIMVNPVKAPSKNRHFVAAADKVTGVVDNAGSLKINSTDFLTMDTVDAMRTVMDQMALPPPVVKIEGDMAAEDDPLRVWLMSPAQYNRFAADPKFRQFQASAHTRASKAKHHPLFLGDVGIWNGFLIMKMQKPIRFYAGDEIKYCADVASETESSLRVPNGFSDKFAIDRSLILGGQAVLEAFAAAYQTKVPFFWNEKMDLDHGNKAELLIGTIRGVAKTRFEVDTGLGMEITDYGVTVVDTVVPILGARQ